MQRIVIYVNGRPLAAVGPWAGVKYSHGWPFGPLRASWQMNPVRDYNLFSGAQVLLMLGGIPIWRGFLNEPGRDGSMSALGLWELAKGAQCFNASGAATAEPRDAFTQARSRGALPGWADTVPDVYPGGAAQQMDAPYPAQSLAALLDYVTEQQGTRWAIDPYSGALITAADPTTPTWLVPHQVAGRGLTPADDDLATHLYAEYLTGPGQIAVTSPAVVSPDYIANTPRVERLVPLIDKGFITDATARTYLTNMFGKGVGKVGWADGLVLDRGDVLTLGGDVLDPALLIAGPTCMGRLAGIWDDRAATPFGNTDIVAAETEYDEANDQVQVKPVGMQPRTIKEAETWTA